MVVLSFAWIVLRGWRGWRAWRRSARHRGVAPRVVPPGGRNAGHVEDDEHVQRCSSRSSHRDRYAVAHRDEKAADSADRRGEAQHSRRFLVGVAHRLFLGLLATPGGLALALIEEDDRDHAERRAVTD